MIKYKTLEIFKGYGFGRV